MDDAEVAEVLAFVIAVDPYGYGQPEGPALDALIDGWAIMLPDVPKHLALRAVAAHYRENPKRISIADIVSGARTAAAADAAQARQRDIEARRAADRAALPAPGATRDRTADIAGLIARYRNWDPVGDLSTRRRQANWHPELDRAYRQALRTQATRDQAARTQATRETESDPIAERGQPE